MGQAIRGCWRGRLRTWARCGAALVLIAPGLAPGPPTRLTAPRQRLFQVRRSQELHRPLPPVDLWWTPSPGAEHSDSRPVDRCLVRTPELDAHFVVQAAEVDSTMVVTPRVRGEFVGAPEYITTPLPGMPDIFNVPHLPGFVPGP